MRASTNSFGVIEVTLAPTRTSGCHLKPPIRDACSPHTPDLRKCQVQKTRSETGEISFRGVAPSLTSLNCSDIHHQLATGFQLPPHSKVYPLYKMNDITTFQELRTLLENLTSDLRAFNVRIYFLLSLRCWPHASVIHSPFSTLMVRKSANKFEIRFAHTKSQLRALRSSYMTSS